MAIILRENIKILSQIALRSTPLHFKVLTNCTKIERCKFGSFVGFLEKWFCCTICSKEGFNSKLFTAMAWRTILKWGSSSEGTTYSLSNVDHSGMWFFPPSILSLWWRRKSSLWEWWRTCLCRIQLTTCFLTNNSDVYESIILLLNKNYIIIIYKRQWNH